MDDRLNKLKQVKLISCQDGNWDYSPYMLGLANGLILAVAIFEDKEPKYLVTSQTSFLKELKILTNQKENQ